MFTPSGIKKLLLCCALLALLLGLCCASSLAEAKGTLTNTYNPEVTSVHVTKVWDDENNRDNIRPETITVQLLADGVVIEEITLPGEDGKWTATKTGLPKYAFDSATGVGGKEIEYTWNEAEVPEGYRVSIEGDVITNTHTPDKTTISVKKVWDDNNDEDGKRKDVKAQFQLIAIVEGFKTLYPETVAVGEEDGFAWTWYDLPTHDPYGNEIQYAVTEILPNGCEYASDTDNSKKEFKPVENGGTVTITNSYTLLGVPHGSWGNLSWILDDDGTLTISGTGKMNDFDYDSTDAWRSHTADIKQVIIQEGVTSISYIAFRECGSLSSITIPGSVTSIGYYAFENCNSLTSVTIPDSMTSISEYAFSGCSSLSSIKIPDGVTSITSGVFSSCSSLSSITIPDSVTSIGNYAFQNCGSLSSVMIPSNVTSIGFGTFMNCSSLSSIAIPNSVRTIKEGAFIYCTNLEEINVENGNSYFSSYVGALFNKDKTKLLACPGAKKQFSIPKSVTSIGAWAFYGCISLSSITIPDSVTSIGNYAFENCNSLISVTIPDSVMKIGNVAFRNCISLTSVTIPDSVTNIGDWVFRDCSSLNNITIPDSVASIGNESFAECSSLTSVMIPDSVTSIGKGAFSGCSKLTVFITPTCGSYAYHWAKQNGLNGVVQSINHQSAIRAAVSPTCTETGLTEGSYCSRCGEVLVAQEPVAALGHIEVTDPAVSATCTETGLTAGSHCSRCGEVLAAQETVAALGHIKVTDPAVSATCTEPGLTAGSHCSRCGEVLAAQETVAALGHIKVTDPAISATCTETGLTAGSHCSRCGEVLAAQETVAALGHTPESVPAVAPTESLSGSTAGSRCAVCGVWLTEPTEVPPTKWQFTDNGTGGDTCSLAHYFGSDTNLSIPSAINGKKVTGILAGAFPANSAVERLMIPKSVESIGAQPFENPPTIYCYDISEADIWAFENGYSTVSVNHPENGAFYIIAVQNQISMEYGASVAVEADIFPMLDDLPITWETGNDKVARVNNGIISAVAPGTATVTLTVGQISRTIQVNVYGIASSFDILPEKLYLVSKTTAQLTLTNVEPAGADATVTWASKNTGIARVDQNGVVTGLRLGETEITATNEKGVSRSCLVHVCYPVSRVLFEKAQYKVIVGGAVQVTALVTCEDETFENQLVSFSSSNESVMTVDQHGRVTCLKAGAVTITALAANGETASCTVASWVPVPIQLPAHLKAIEEEAFAGAAFEAVEIPEGCTSIGSRAFADCPNLKYVRVPASVVSIADDAFAGCGDVVIDRVE